MKIHIPEPCSEKWDEMTPSEKGAFCEKCAIDVMDFTRKSPFEIRDILSGKFKNKEHSCGRIQYGQMEAVNEIGFYWRNEKHRFQSVWMVSLLAVFGMSLFSCQNTISKEVVAKMEEEGSELLQDSLEQVSIAPTNDTIATDPWGSVVTTNPWEGIQTHGGTILPYETDWDLELKAYILTDSTICIISGMMGEVLGAFSPPEEPAQEGSLNRFGSRPIQTNQPNGENVGPWPHRNNTTKRADMVYDTETDDFIAYITPAPVSSESKLVIESFGDHEIYITLENVKSLHFYTDKRIEVKEGVQVFQLGLDKLPKGDYELELNSYRTNRKLQFHWEGVQ